MRPAVLVLILSSLLGIGLAHPAEGSDNRVGFERPSTETPPQVSECGLDCLLGEVFGISDNSDFKSGGSNPPPNGGGSNLPPSGGGSNLPPSGGGEYPSQPLDPEPVPQPNSQPGPEGCTCVPYYMCNYDNTINEDGVGLIDIRYSHPPTTTDSDKSAEGESGMRPEIKDVECSDYLQKCCRGSDIRPNDQPLIPKPLPLMPRPTINNNCGNRNLEGIGFRITGNNDNEAQYGEFPWMVAVIRSYPTVSQQGKSVNIYQCGGSLIHPQVVLTGAYCVRGKDNLFIRAGEWDTQTKSELYPTQDRKVQEVIVHEQFNTGSLANDPALLILENPVNMTVENVGLICLPEPNENMDGRECVASGWGKDLFGKEGKYSVILKRVDVPMVPRQQCLQALRKTRLGPHFKLHESFVCAGGQPGKDTCKGDGGGPLICPTKDNPRMYVQAGIVSWGIECSTETPGVYVNVPYFVNWINDKMQARNIA